MDILEFLKTRRTYRRFKQEEISQNIIEEMLIAAGYASSAGNKQPLNYVVIKDKKNVQNVFELTYWARYLPSELGVPTQDQRPTLFVAIVQNKEISIACDIDVGLAISNMTLVAWEYGVGSCIIGAFEKEKLSKMMGLSEQENLHTIVAFGYPSHNSKLVMMENDDVRYYLDSNGDYLVPKRKMQDIIRYL